MAREYAQIRLDLWSDPDVRRLTERAQRLYLHLLTSPSLNYAGVADWRPAKLSGFAADSTPETVRAAGAELAVKYFLVIDEAVEEVMIRSFLRHDGLLRQPKVAVTMTTAYASLSSALLRGVIVHELLRLRDEHPDWAAWTRPQVLTILKHDAIDPKALPAPEQVGLDVPLGGELGVGLGVALPKTLPSVSGLLTPAPTPTPTPSSKEDGKTTSSSPTASKAFDEFWSRYPRKVGKVAARKAFTQALRMTDVSAIIRGVEALKIQVAGKDPQFTPHPATWLNEGRWDDEAPGQQQIPTNSPWDPSFHRTRVDS